MKFTLGKMFAAVAMLALACAGMLYRDLFWATLIFTLTTALFVAIMLSAIGMRGRNRAVALLSATVGISYLVLITGSVYRGPRQYLLTNYPLALAARAIQVALPSPVINVVPSSPQTYSPYLGSVSVPPPSPISPTVPQLPASSALPYTVSLEALILVAYSDDDEYYPVARFFVIGHCVFSWMFAVLAAWFTGRMYDKRLAPAV